jgi:hypothetical protein
MTYGGDTYGGSALGSTSDTQQEFSGSVESTTSIDATITSVQTETTVNPTTTITSSFQGSAQRFGTVQPVTTISAEPTDATAAVDLGEQWRILRDGTTEEPDLYDIEVVSTANPFGSYAIAKIDDTEGSKFEDYTRGTRVDFEYSTNLGISWTERFSGFVVEARELNEQGADALEVECYSFDQFLRRDTVTNDQSGNTISEALEDIIKTDTPVTWVSGNVDVQDDQTLTRSYRGERVENVIQSLRSKSAFEDFGVNSDLEFFFEPQETTSSPRNIDNSQWFNYDIPEEGKRTINQVTVFFDGGDKSVTVDNGGDKLALQDSLGTDDPITFAEEVTREDITNIEDARDEAEKILSDRETTLTGTVTTYGLLGADTGDVININIIDRGINGDFAIAEIKYLWGRGETQLTIVEKRGDQDDLLVGLSDTVKRVEMRQANRDATENRITNTNVGGIITVGGDIDGTSYTTFRYTNVGRNKVRDGWADNGNLDISHIAVGNDATGPTRTNDSLGNELERTTVSENLPDSTTAEYSGSFTTTDIREIGLFTSDGDLIARATIPDTTLSSPVTGTVSLSVSNDSSIERGVLTNAGQTTTRDIIADNSPSLPTQYAYGTDSTSPTESDTSLGSQVVSVSIDEKVVQEADTTSEWNSILSISDTTPLKVDSGELVATQTCWTEEGEDLNTNTAINQPETDFSNGNSVGISDQGDYVEHTFTPEHDISNTDVEWHYRIETTGIAPEVEFTINGEVVESTKYDFGSVTWTQAGSNPSSDLTAGNQVTCRAEVVESGVNEVVYIDVSAPRDARYTYNNDNSVDGSNGYLDGPELYPDLVEQAFNQITTRQELASADVTQVWNDVSNNQFIELSNDGGSTWITTNNSQTASANFGSPSTTLQTRVGVSRYGSRTGTTPKTGFNPQAIDTHELLADIVAIGLNGVGSVNVRGIVSPGIITAGTTLTEGAELDSSNNALTRVVFAGFDVSSSMRVTSSETVGWSNP